MLSLTRAIVLAELGDNGDIEVITEAKKRFALFMQGERSSIPSELKPFIFGLVITVSNPIEEYNYYKN